MDSAARASNTYYLYGRVCEEERGIPLRDGQVYLIDTRFGALTDSAGYYWITGVPQGIYTATFRGMSYFRETREVRIASGCLGIRHLDRLGRPYDPCSRGTWLSFSARSSSTF
jgi:hypothetical protein